MNQDILKGQWRQIQGEAKKTFGKLTDNDWQVIGGHVDSFIGSVQERYGITKEQASDQVRKFADGVRNDYPDTYDYWYNDAGNDAARAANNAANKAANTVSNAANSAANSVSNAADNVQDAVRDATRTY